MQRERTKSGDGFRRRSYEFALDVIRLVDGLPKEPVSNVLAQQLLRSGTSIGANVIEASAASSKKDYANFFSHALKSANETKSWVALLVDSSRADRDNARRVLKEANEIANILGASILTLKGKREIKQKPEEK